MPTGRPPVILTWWDPAALGVPVMRPAVLTLSPGGSPPTGAEYVTAWPFSALSAVTWTGLTAVPTVEPCWSGRR